MISSEKNVRIMYWKKLKWQYKLILKKSLIRFYCEKILIFYFIFFLKKKKFFFSNYIVVKIIST